MKFLKLPSTILLISLLSLVYTIIFVLNLYKSPFFPSGESPDFYYHLSSSFQLSKGSTSFLLTFYPPLAHFIGAFFILLSPANPIILFKSGFLALSVSAIPLLFIVSRDLAKDNLIASISTLLYIFFSPIWFYSQIEAYLYPTMLAFILFLLMQIVLNKILQTGAIRYYLSFALLLTILPLTHYYVLPLFIAYFALIPFLWIHDYRTHHDLLGLGVPRILPILPFIIPIVFYSIAVFVFPRLLDVAFSLLRPPTTSDVLTAPHTYLSYFFRDSGLSTLFRLGYSDLYSLLILLSLPAAAISLVFTPTPKRRETLLLVAPIIGWTLILLVIALPSQSWRTTHALYLALTPLSVYPLLLLKKGVERL